MTAGISFAGLVTNLPTDQLISAILNQESQPMVAMQKQVTTNNTKTAALQTLEGDLGNLTLSMDTLTNTGLSSNTVTSSDSTNQYVSATASGASNGAYDVAVKALATTARIVVPTAMASNAAVGTGTYSITDMAGTTANITIDSSNNTLAGLAQAINNYTDPTTGNALDVSATVIQTGADGSSQLVLSSNNTGVGSNGATTFSMTMADGSTLSPASPSLTSSAAQNSDFFLNGAELQRTSNVVSDAVSGVTFTLNKPQTDLTQTTHLAVGLDAGAATTALQGVVSAYNQFYKDYTSNTTFTQNTDGSYTAGVFNMDMTVQNMVNQVSSTLMNAAPGLSSTARYTTPAAVGLKTNEDGTISLDTTAFQAAFNAHPQDVANLFTHSGSSTSPLLSLLSAGSNTTTNPITFSVANQNGVLTGTFSTTKADGTAYSTSLTSTDGSFYGASGTPLEGLVVSAQDGATGTLKASQGISAVLQTLDLNLTSLSPGEFGGMINSLATQNSDLNSQILQQQHYLATSKASLETTYSNLETSVSSLQSASASLSTLA